MRSFNFAAIALAAFAYVAPASAGVYLNAADWYTQAVVPNVVSGSASLAVMPAQTATHTDNFHGTRDGNYKPFFSDAGGTGAGQMNGLFECQSFSTQCFGAHTITYTLPYEISGMAGDLSLGVWYLGSLTEVPFFQLTDSVGGPYSYPDNIPGTFKGFWGTTFAPTDTLTLTWTPGLINTDAGANFTLSNLMVLKTDTTGAAPVPVPEPASLALFGLGLAGMVAVRRRRKVAAA
ncbi:PEP-CTERM sorting domain-containing protein [Falsiroseomonas sp. HC035]|uniref:PEP-CTERM sorting domain-containing protein n=1 Tax=Falsiroseomonas sp. HC035 TaxID=3390999 RepID=UPI003D323A9C